MFRQVLKISAIIVAAGFSSFALAMEPLVAISQDDPDFAYYSEVAELNQKMVNDGLVGVYTDFNMFNVNGRIVPLADGSDLNPFNLVVTVNGNLYYVDSILSTVDSFKIRRRWSDNPEPGVFLRIEGRRTNPEDGHSEIVQVWIKIATPEGRALPVLKLLEGNYDLPENPSVQPAYWDGYTPGQPNPGPVLPPPPFI